MRHAHKIYNLPCMSAVEMFRLLAWQAIRLVVVFAVLTYANTALAASGSSRLCALQVEYKNIQYSLGSFKMTLTGPSGWTAPDQSCTYSGRAYGEFNYTQNKIILGGFSDGIQTGILMVCQFSLGTEFSASTFSLTLDALTDPDQTSLLNKLSVGTDFVIKDVSDTTPPQVDITDPIVGNPSSGSPGFGARPRMFLVWLPSSDQQGSNQLINDTTGDGNQVKTLFLGTGVSYNTNSLQDPAEVTAVTETLYLDPTTDSATLWAKAKDDSQVQSAWIEIRSPSMTLVASGSKQQVEINLDRFLLSPPVNGRWSVDLTGKYKFQDSGMYEIYYFAKDKESGDISPMMRSLVYKQKAGNAAPSAFSLLSPVNEAQGWQIDSYQHHHAGRDQHNFFGVHYVRAEYDDFGSDNHLHTGDYDFSFVHNDRSG
ncbi:MAG: hypothetical protein H7839_22400 [Magnetococcus sp. YQC-5]